MSVLWSLYYCNKYSNKSKNDTTFSPSNDFFPHTHTDRTPDPIASTAPAPLGKTKGDLRLHHTRARSDTVTPRTDHGRDGAARESAGRTSTLPVPVSRIIKIISTIKYATSHRSPHQHTPSPSFAKQLKVCSCWSRPEANGVLDVDFSVPSPPRRPL